MRVWSTCALFLLCAIASGIGGCSDDEETNSGAAGTGGGRPDLTGAACETPADCYPGVDQSAVLGEVQCLDRVDDGYCTHLCETDEDCCAATGECNTEIAQVCSPFESTGLMMCFLSCEDADLVATDGGPIADGNDYCQREASPEFICRSSGGGSDNRRICVPGDCDVGEACSADADCAADLSCATSFQGGYCTRANCVANADCPANSVCVSQAGNNYCLRTCGADSDCGFCRPFAQRLSCSADVIDVAGASASVCTPS